MSTEAQAGYGPNRCNRHENEDTIPLGAPAWCPPGGGPLGVLDWSPITIGAPAWLVQLSGPGWTRLPLGALARCPACPR